jgi:transposase-like protein
MKDIFCPECGTKMHKAGFAVSGRKRVQRYRCPNPKCLRTTIKKSENHEDK